MRVGQRPTLEVESLEWLDWPAEIHRLRERLEQWMRQVCAWVPDWLESMRPEIEAFDVAVERALNTQP